MDSVVSFDFIEGEPDDYFKIFGISLNGERKSPLPKVSYDKDEELFLSIVSNEKAILKGEIFGYNPDMGTDILKYQYRPFGDSEDTQGTFPIDEKGRFRIELTPYFPTSLYTSFGTCYIVPGKTTEVYYDLVTSEVEYKGVLAAFNKDIKRISDKKEFEIDNLIIKTLNEIDGKNESEAIACLNNNTTAFLDTIRTLKLCKAAEQNTLMNIQYYYSSIREALPRYCQMWAQQMQEDTTRTAPYQTPLFTEALKSENMLEFYDNSNTPYFSYIDYNVSNHHPLAIEAERVQKIIEKIYNGYKPTEEDLKEYDGFSSPVYKEIILKKQAETERQMAEFDKMENVHYMTMNDVPDDQLIEKLLEPYKGKPVVVDIWATWCGPCKAAMKTILPVKETLKDKVTFLYLTGKTSPKNSWAKMIGDITGEHYYLTQTQYSYILGKYESQGVPTYLLFDGNGRFSQKYVGYPGNDVIKNALESLIK